MYDVYALKYAERDTAKSQFSYRESSHEPLTLNFFVWLIRGGGRNVLVDAGFYRPQFFKSLKVRDFVRPDDAVAHAGPRPQDARGRPRQGRPPARRAD